MTAILDSSTADKLAKLCGMFGSEHMGERAAAAQRADRLVKSRGLSWFDVILPIIASCDSVADKIALALANLDALSMWERGFIYSVRGKHSLSEKQEAVLDAIAAKARACAEAA